MRILIVDDDADQNQLIIDAIEIYNDENSCDITPETALTKNDAMEKLKNNSYDAAFIDLKLSQNDTDGEGNEIIKVVYENLRFPIRIISGNPEILNSEYKVKDTILFQNRQRGTVEYNEVIDELYKIHETGIVNILNNKGKIQENISNVFWNHLSTVIPVLIEFKSRNTIADIEKILLRYTASLLSEYLELSIENNLEAVHHIELYIQPPIKSKIFTGDIILLQEEELYGIILTPACDLATDVGRQAKAEYITVAIIENKEDVERGKNNGYKKQLLNNNADLKYHFLPETILFRGGYINFQNLRSIKYEDFENKKLFSIECVITNPFRKDIISRFSNYFSRQGQPTFV